MTSNNDVTSNQIDGPLSTNLDRTVQLCFGGKFAAFSKERRDKAKAAFAATLGLADTELVIKPLDEDKTDYLTSLPVDKSEALHDLLKTNNGQLRLLDLNRVVMERSSGAVEEWTVEKGRFTLTASAPPVQLDESGQPIDEDNPSPRIWIFHLAYLFVSLALAASILRFSAMVSLSLLFITVLSLAGLILARYRQILLAHVLGVAVGLAAPVIICARLQPVATLIMLSSLVTVIFFVRRIIF